jgi:hypothetical protein
MRSSRRPPGFPAAGADRALPHLASHSGAPAGSSLTAATDVFVTLGNRLRAWSESL